MSYSITFPAYTIGVDAYQKVPTICEQYGSKIVVVGGKRALDCSKEKLLQSIKNSKLEILDFLWFGGDATFENMDMIMTNDSFKKADMIFACGGGRALDFCKALQMKTQKPLFTFPTIASTCAAVTKLSILYNKDGSFREKQYMENPPIHTFIDSQIIVDAPQKYLWAGVGDTLAKNYESKFSARGKKHDHTNELGLQIAPLTAEPLLKYAPLAMEASENKKVDFAFEQTILSIIVSTGLVSILVNKDYNTNLAHGIYYGLTILKQIEEHHYHGEVVAYGLLVLLMYDEQYEELQKMYKLATEMKFPRCMADLDVDFDEMKKAILKTMDTTDIVVSPYKIEYDKVLESIQKLEKYNLPI